MRVLVKSFFLIGLFLSCMVQSAQACTIARPFALEAIDQADAIFLGQINRYEILAGENSTAKLTFMVLQTIKGSVGNEIIALWQNSTFEIPKNRDEYITNYGEKLIIGIVEANESSARKLKAKTTEYPFVFQNPCAPPFMLSDRNRNMFLFVEELKSRRLTVDESYLGKISVLSNRLRLGSHPHANPP